jgi:hypothetical protein
MVETARLSHGITPPLLISSGLGDATALVTIRLGDASCCLGCALLRNYRVITEVMVFLGQKYMLRFFYSAVAGGPEFTVIKNVLALRRNHVGIEKIFFLS